MAPNDQSKKRRDLWLATVLFALSCVSYAQGAVYVNTRMKEVTTFDTSQNSVCMESLSENPKVAMRVKLFVTNLNTNDVLMAGEVNLKYKLLLPVYTSHRITISHVEDGTQMSGVELHTLKVLLDGVEMEFNPGEIDAYNHVYRFDHIALLLKGTANIYPCEETSSPPTSTVALTTTTTTTPQPPTTTSTTTVVPASVVVAEEERGGEEEEVKEEEKEEEMKEEQDAGSNGDVHQHREVAAAENEQPGEKEENNDKPWWHFVFILGDFKGIPVLILLIILFCVGLGIGSVSTILCEQYCSACQDDEDEENKLHDASFDHRMIPRTDYNGLSNDPMYSTSLSAGRLTKDSISNPIQATAPTSNPYGPPHYMSPRDRDWQREQMEYPLRNSSDETLPLNVPLPQDHQNPHSSSSGSYEHYDPYRETSLNL